MILNFKNYKELINQYVNKFNEDQKNFYLAVIDYHEKFGDTEYFYDSLQALEQIIIHYGFNPKNVKVESELINQPQIENDSISFVKNYFEKLKTTDGITEIYQLQQNGHTLHLKCNMIKFIHSNFGFPFTEDDELKIGTNEVKRKIKEYFPAATDSLIYLIIQIVKGVDYNLSILWNLFN